MSVSNGSEAAVAPRDLAPDVVRGFALFGILLVNLAFFSHGSLDGVRGEDVSGPGNEAATLAVMTLLQGKFYLLFSFLFGYSSHYIVKGEKSGRPRWVARSLLLVGIGIVHFTFAWHGDILFIYGLFGVALLLFLFRDDWLLKVWAWVFWAGSMVVMSALSGLTWLGEAEGFDLSFPDPVLDEVMRSGSYADSIAPRVELWSEGFVGGVALQGGLVFAAFLVGVIAGRRKLLTTNSHLLRTGPMLGWGIGVGLPLQFLAAWLYVRNETSGQASEGVYFGTLTLGLVTAPLLAMAYLAILVMLAEHAPRTVSWLRYPGRMALTNYIAQSVVLSLVFGPWGLGLFEQLEYWVAVVIAVVIFCVLTLASVLWLKFFQQGPLEKLVGVLTRGTIVTESDTPEKDSDS
jgi:uncharacterized protein